VAFVYWHSAGHKLLLYQTSGAMILVKDVSVISWFLCRIGTSCHDSCLGFRRHAVIFEYGLDFEPWFLWRIWTSCHDC